MAEHPDLLQEVPEHALSWLGMHLWEPDDSAPLHYLDVGCGLACPSRALRRDDRYVGVDISPPTVRAALELRPHLEISVAEARALPFPDASFDRVLFLNTLQHVPGDHADVCFGEFARVLRPGGRAFVLWRHDIDEGWVLPMGARDRWWFCRHEIEETFERLGAAGLRASPAAINGDGSTCWFWSQKVS